MLSSAQLSRKRANSSSRLEAVQTIPNHLALALVGQTVSLLDHAHRIAHGVVAGVINEMGRPKLVVGRVEYDLDQVLSVTPPLVN